MSYISFLHNELVDKLLVIKQKAARIEFLNDSIPKLTDEPTRTVYAMDVLDLIKDYEKDCETLRSTLLEYVAEERKGNVISITARKLLRTRFH